MISGYDPSLKVLTIPEIKIFLVTSPSSLSYADIFKKFALRVNGLPRLMLIELIAIKYGLEFVVTLLSLLFVLSELFGLLFVLSEIFGLVFVASELL
jgi:hypothetical protein